MVSMVSIDAIMKYVVKFILLPIILTKYCSVFLVFEIKIYLVLTK